MATGETGFDDVTFDLVSVQYHSLKAGHDYGQYVRDARNAGRDDIASFFEQVMKEDSDRAHQCHRFLRELGGTDNTSRSGDRPPSARPVSHPSSRGARPSDRGQGAVGGAEHAACGEQAECGQAERRLVAALHLDQHADGHHRDRQHEHQQERHLTLLA